MKITLICSICALLMILIVSCESNDALEFDRYYAEGNVIYQSHCQNCHGAHGEGLNGLIPPLTDSVFLKNNRDQLACLVHNGLHGKITVTKKDFTEKMPAAADLANIEIAQALTYVTNSFGNKMGIVNVEEVNGDLVKCL